MGNDNSPVAAPGGNLHVCHPFCLDECHFPFNWRYCSGDFCRATVNGDPITAPASSSFSDSNYPNIDYPPRQTPTGDVIRSLPPQCSPDRYDGPNAGTWGWNKSFNNNFNDNWFTGNNNRAVADPFTAVPLARDPRPMDTLITAVVPGATPPPFVPVPHNETITNTTTVNPIRTEASEWWKVWLLIGALLLLLSVILLAIFCGPKERIRIPIKKVEEEIPILIQEEVVIEQPKPII